MYGINRLVRKRQKSGFNSMTNYILGIMAYFTKSQSPDWLRGMVRVFRSVMESGTFFDIKTIFSDLVIPVVKNGWSHNHFNFTIGILVW